MTKLIPVAYLLFFISFEALCQTSTITDEADRIKNFFAKSALETGSSLLYNGYEYRGYPHNYFKEGHQFLGSGDWNIGTVTYDGVDFMNVPILYDVTKDALIIRSFDLVSRITLVKSKVKKFSFSGRSFITIPAINNENPSDYKYYEQLYHEKLTLLVKRDKKITESVNSAGVERFVQASNKYYLRRDNNYYPVKNPKSLLNILSDKKAQLKKYLTDNRIKHKKDPEAAMIAITAYYDQISN